MKTISELSGTVIRMAAAAIAEARRSLPAEEPPADAPPPAAPEAAASPADAAAEAAPVEAGNESAPPEAGAEAAPTEAGAESAPPEAGAEAAPTEAAGKPGTKPEPRRESEAEKAALDEAAATATGFSGDRLTMLRAAVEVAGSRLKDVRLVRVFGVEEQLNGGRIVGEYQYVVDFHPTAMKQVAGSHKEERGGRGGGRGRGGGGGGGPGGGGRGAKGSTTGGFSMDSLRDDRKKEGGARGRPGGARRPGGPGRPPGGPPKK
jgi:translation initiation factor IF-2